MRQVWGHPDTKLFSPTKGYYMKYVCSRTRRGSDIWTTPLGTQHLQFLRLGSSSCPISFLLDRNNSSRWVWETEAEIRALLVDESGSEGRTCRWVNYSCSRRSSSRHLTLQALCCHFQRTLFQTFSLFDYLAGVSEKGRKICGWFPTVLKCLQEQLSSLLLEHLYIIVIHILVHIYIKEI